MKQKLICVLLAIMLVASGLAGCTGKDSSSGASGSTSQEDYSSSDNSSNEEDDDDYDDDAPKVYTGVNKPAYINPGSKRENGKMAFLSPENAYSAIEGESIIVTIDDASIDYSDIVFYEFFVMSFGSFEVSDFYSAYPNIDFRTMECKTEQDKETSLYMEYSSIERADNIEYLADDGKWGLTVANYNDTIYYNIFFRLEEEREGFKTSAFVFAISDFNKTLTNEDAMNIYNYIKGSVNIYKAVDGSYVKGENLATGEVSDLSSYTYFQDILADYLGSQVGLFIKDPAHITSFGSSSEVEIEIPYNDTTLICTVTDESTLLIDEEDVFKTFDFRNEKVQAEDLGYGMSFWFENKRDYYLRVDVDISRDDIDAEGLIKVFIEQFE